MNTHDKILWLLVGGVLFYTLVTVGVVVFLPTSEKLYTVVGGLLGNFSGALFMYLHLKGPGGPQ